MQPSRNPHSLEVWKVPSHSEKRLWGSPTMRVGPTGTGGESRQVGSAYLPPDFALLFLCVSLKQPHNILQKRLMETNLSKLRGSRGNWASKSDAPAQSNRLNQAKLGSSRSVEDEELLVVSCQVTFPTLPLPPPPHFSFDSLTAGSHVLGLMPVIQWVLCMWQTVP